MSRTLHKECAETILDAISDPVRDPGPTVSIIRKLLQDAGAVSKEKRNLDPPKADQAEEKPAKKKTATKAA